MTRALHFPNIGGSIDADLGDNSGGTDTTMSSPALAALGDVAAPDYVFLCLDPDAVGGVPEWLKITAHVAGATTATVTRGEEGTTPRAHVAASGIRWVHDLAPSEADQIGTPTATGGASDVDDPTAFETIFGADLGYDQEFDRENESTLPAGWSWVNQGTATYAERFGAGVISLPANTGTDVVRGLVRSAPASASWFLKGKILAPGALVQNNILWGLMLRDSASGKLTTWGITAHASGFLLELLQWNGPTAFSSKPAGIGVHGYGLLYWGIRKNSATSYDFLISADGIGWKPVFLAHDPSAFMTIDQIGFFGNVMQTQGTNPNQEFSCHWLRVR